MYLKKLKAENFRNIQSPEIEFSKGINVLYGKNASGKTNALEAVYLFASGKSLRGSPEKELIKKGAEFSNISLDFVSDKSENIVRNMSLSFLGQGRKAMKYGYSEIPKMSEFLGHFRACVFTPDDLSLVKGSPEERRKFMDICISQLSPKFVHFLNSYHKILAQKNSVLKKAMQGGTADRTYLEILNEQLSAAASTIVKQRAGFCEKLCDYAKKIYRDISDEKEFFGMKYLSMTKKNYSDEEYTRSTYLELMSKNTDREIKYGMSLYGPHKDDIYFCLGKDCAIPDSEITEEKLISETEFSARSFGSRGQQRSVVLSLKLAQGELFREIIGEYPVFLLDDVFSELDRARRNYILSDTEKKQIIITCCDCDILGSFKDYNGIYVEDGIYKNV